jgi:hypothetical protein
MRFFRIEGDARNRGSGHIRTSENRSWRQDLSKREKKAFGEFMSKRKCLEEYDRIKQRW